MSENAHPDERERADWEQCLDEQLSAFDRDEEEAHYVCDDAIGVWFDEAANMWRQVQKKILLSISIN